VQNCCVSAQRWTAADLPDMSGKTVIVTGASSGLGVATARDFARAGARVILAVRNVAKGTAVAQGIAGHTEVRRLELADLASIRAFADAWTGDIDILVNNAGIMWVPAGKTVDGFEMQIGTNHLGHFALTNRLLPHITGRVVTVSSYLHRGGHIDVDDINWERRRYRPTRAYADSKQANLLFTLELQRRLAARGSSVAPCPLIPGSHARRSPRAPVDCAASWRRWAPASWHRMRSRARCRRCTPPRRTFLATRLSGRTASLTGVGIRWCSSRRRARRTLRLRPDSGLDRRT
jgi:NAD(P)-dependent dehydrogenase (short-subunit alcohol dehydrogenase family)